MTSIRSPLFAITLSTLLAIGMFRNAAGFGSSLAFVQRPNQRTTAFTTLKAESEDEAEFVYSRRRRRGEEIIIRMTTRNKTRSTNEMKKERYLDDYDVRDEYVDDDEDDDKDDDDDDFWDEEEYDVLSNDLIPNPILDNMDPDGAAERFPELARDPRFWFDMLLFVTFLDLLSIIGPRDPYPDIPWL